MPTLAGPPLQKVTLNLYAEDCATLEHHYGRGWTTAARDVINDHAHGIRRSTPQRRTLEDLLRKNGDTDGD